MSRRHGSPFDTQGVYGHRYETRSSARTPADFAAAQGGIVFAEQLQACGLSYRQIRRRVANRVLRDLGAGVFQFGPLLTDEARRTAAARIGAPEYALAFHSAQELLQCGAGDPRGLHLTVLKGREIRPVEGVIAAVHHTRGWRAHDVTTRFGVRVTTASRTACDLATLDDDALIRAFVTRATHKRLLTPKTFTELSRMHPGHPGLARVTALAPRRQPTESPLEDRVRDEILAGLDLPPVTGQYVLHGLSGRAYRADFACERARVLIEADGREAHEREAAFLSDRARDNDVLAVGWITIRITSDMLRRRTATRRQVDATIRKRL